MKIYGATDIGLVRPTNQDCYYIDKEQNWAVLADGMGGHSGGETASTMSVEIIKENMDKSNDPVTAIEEANRIVFQKSVDEPLLSGMGTTIVLCKIDGNKAQIAHVGDSRAYVVREQCMEQITTDHSIVQQLIDSGTITKEQSKYHPQRNLITRAVGTEKGVAVDVNTVSFNENESILLCSDGLCSYVEENEIFEIIKNNTAEKAVEMLVEAANNAGGKDNVTAVLMNG